jgi:adenylylsulfate reductase subunit B
MGASVVPLRGSEDIMWTVKFRNGTVKRFKFPIRTTPEGKAVPYPAGWDTGTEDLKDQILCTEPASAGATAMPTLKK